PKPIRRIVTGHNEKGRSVILSDGLPPNTFRPPYFADGGITELWETTNTPASNEGDNDASVHPLRLSPPPSGSIFRIVDFPPDSLINSEEMEKIFHLIGGGREYAEVRKGTDQPAPRHAGFHRTSSVDYAIILEGEIWAMLDEGEALMKAGDILVQRGTNHS